jgi:hypothetical protein
MKKILSYSSAILFLTGLLSTLNADSRMNRLSWTDRGVSNPPLTESSSIDSTIETFWNVTLAEEATTKSAPRVTSTPPGSTSTKIVPSTQVEQDRSTRERRGYFGINLFNVIPLIDFVHGDVTSESKDNVKGRR